MIRDIVQSVAVVPDPILRNVYVEMVAEKFEMKPDSILASIAGFRRKKLALERSRRRFDESSSSPVIPGSALDLEPEERIPEDLPDAGTVPPSGSAEAYPLKDGYLAVPERELTYYLVKFGEYPMYFEEDMYYGAEQHEEMTVSQYIRDALADDDLVFVNDLYRTIFERYYAYLATLPREESEAMQQRIIRYFTAGDDPAVARAVLDLILEEHPLTVRTYEESITPEEQALGRTVPKSVLLYKLRITGQQCTATAREITLAQRGGDQDNLRELVARLQVLNTVKNRLSKELNRL